MLVSNGLVIDGRTPLDPRGSSWFSSFPPMSQPWTGQSPATYAAMFRRQLWVKVVITKRALALARLPLPVYERDGLNRPRVDDHPMARLLERPNGSMSAFDLIQWVQSIQDIFGNAALWKKRDARGNVTELWPLHPTRLVAKEDGSWRFGEGATAFDVAPLDLIHFRTFDPERLEWGMSPLEPLRATLENEWASRSATQSFWQRGARPSLALMHPRTLSTPALERLRAQVQVQHVGPQNNGSVLILEEGMEAKPFQLTAEESQYIETRRMNREEVCAAFDVPPPVVHVLDRATFSNITEQMRSMYRDTMAPVCSAFQSTIERDLRAVEWPSDPVYAEFLMDDVMRGSFEARQSALAQATYMTIAEKRRAENLPYLEGTDRIFMNTATLPLDAIDAQAAALVQSTRERVAELDASSEPDAAAVAPVIPLRSARAVVGRLGWQASPADIDVAAVTKGLDECESALVSRLVAEHDSVPDIRAAILAAAAKETA